MVSSWKMPRSEGLVAGLPARALVRSRPMTSLGDPGTRYDSMTSPMTIRQTDTHAGTSASPMADTQPHMIGLTPTNGVQHG